jgi:hypothetical protein
MIKSDDLTKRNGRGGKTMMNQCSKQHFPVQSGFFPIPFLQGIIV